MRGADPDKVYVCVVLCSNTHLLLCKAHAWGRVTGFVRVPCALVAGKVSVNSRFWTTSYPQSMIVVTMLNVLFYRPKGKVLEHLC
jgi:hypothetical protein